MAPPVVLFLSSGRCGTQWLAAGLRRFHTGVWVEHEPIGPLYAPRRHFRAYDHPEAILQTPAVAGHVQEVERSQRPYVETGWPLFAVIPLLAERLGDRLRVVHLTRHPVPTALSHMAHSSYAGSARDDPYTRLATLGPTDPGVVAVEYADRWPELTPYEKCLFWWTEVHNFGLELPTRLPVRWLRVQSERLLAGERETLSELLDFLEQPWHEGWLEHAGRRVDRWHHHTDRAVDPLLVHDHPRTVEVAARLGYDVDDIDLDGLRRRYRGQPDPGLDRLGRYERST